MVGGFSQMHDAMEYYEKTEQNVERFLKRETT